MPNAEESSSSGSEESDSSSDEEVELDPQQLEKLMKLEEQLEASPTDYNQQVEVRLLLPAGTTLLLPAIRSNPDHLEEQLEASPTDYNQQVEVRLLLLAGTTLLLPAIRSNPDHLTKFAVFHVVQYINLLRQARLRTRLRSAHERMASLFPLTEQLWLDWINDELEMVGHLGYLGYWAILCAHMRV